MIYFALYLAIVYCQRFLAKDEDLNHNPQCYGAIFDAGSTGTRVYIYQWNCREKSTLPMVNITESKNNKKITPGLDYFANNLKEIQPYLQPLIDYIYEVVPANVYQYTPIMLGATASMRALPFEDQVAIISTVQKIFKQSKFLYNPEWVRIITGQEEGMYMWMSVYYLLNLNEKRLLTIDLGGASTQISFPYKGTTPDFVEINVDLPPNVTNYNLYSPSYPGFGNDIARMTVQSLLIKKGSIYIFNPCYFYGYSEYWIWDQTYQIIGTGKLSECQAIIQQFLNTDQTHSINGNYEPPVTQKEQVYATNGIAIIAKFFHLPSFTESSFYSKMQTFTELTWEQAQQQYPNEPYLANNFFLSVYSYELIKTGYNIPATTTIYAPETINGLTPSWTLAACSYQLAQINCTIDSPACHFDDNFQKLLSFIFLIIFMN